MWDLSHLFPVQMMKEEKRSTDTLNRKLNEYKQTYNASSMMITEYGAGANINQHATMDENFFMVF